MILTFIPDTSMEANSNNVKSPTFLAGVVGDASSLIHTVMAASCTLRIFKVLWTLILKYAKTSHWKNTLVCPKNMSASRVVFL